MTYGEFKRRVRALLPIGGPVFNFLNLLSGILESKEKLFAIREALLYPKYGPTYLDRRYYEYLNRLGSYLGGKEVDVIDIGANRGWFIHMSHRFLNVRKITAYEPAQHNNRTLNKLVRKYGNVQVRNVLLGEKAEDKNFYLYESDGLSSTRPLNPDFHFEDNFGTALVNTSQVSCVRLDQDLPRLETDDKRPLVLKIDTQASEMEILRGARALFEQNRIAAVVIELLVDNMYMNQENWLAILEFFDTRGFKILDLISPNARNPDGTINEFDAIFVASKQQGPG